MQELLDVPANLHVGTVEPRLDPHKPLKSAARREAGQVPFRAEGPKCPLKERAGNLRTEARPGRRTEQQPRGPVVVDGNSQVMKPAEVDVSRRDGEPVFVVEVFGKIGEAVPMPRCGLEVV